MPYIAERWDRFKLKRFKDRYRISFATLIKDMKLSKGQMAGIMAGNVSLDQYEAFLTGYKNAIKKARIKESITYCNEMIKVL